MLSNKYDELSASSKIIIDELTEEYKEILILRALEENGYKNLEELQPRDIVIVDEKIKQYQSRNNNKKERMIKLLRILGLVYAFLGVCMYFYLNIDISNEPLQMGSMLVGTSGVLIFLVTYLYEYYRNNLRVNKREYRMKQQYFVEYEIIRKWAEIEMLAYKLIEKNNVGENNNIPISKLINELISSNVLDDIDKDDFRYVLNLRNNIAHPSMEGNSQLNIKEGLYKADKIISKLKGNI
ncbi:hypothetical protein MHB43_08045 [Paenibacillus sp. FSL H8-0317]|uniref:hypothetical protein n=1 Tax=Paenibacillus sp. FSL H8-0317 TaxID=2921385 RepID=UPI00324D6B9C